MNCEDHRLASYIDCVPPGGPDDPEPQPDILHGPRLRGVRWRDLVHVTPFEILREPACPAGRLAASLLAAAYASCNRAGVVIFVFPHGPAAHPQRLSLRAEIVSPRN